MGVCCRSLERALRARVGSSRGKAQLPKLGSDCSSSELLSKRPKFRVPLGKEITWVELVLN